MRIGHSEGVFDHKVVICVGTGGVGKTTVSAALALEAARRGKRALVLTVIWSLSSAGAR